MGWAAEQVLWLRGPWVAQDVGTWVVAMAKQEGYASQLHEEPTPPGPGTALSAGRVLPG